jgi:hypothetical protein
MTATRDGEVDRIGSLATGSRVTAPALAVRFQSLSSSGLLAFSAPVLFPRPRWSDTPRGSADVRGLDLIERKAPARREPGAAVPRTVDSIAPLWIGVPFTAVFVLGCLTLG